MMPCMSVKDYSQIHPAMRWGLSLPSWSIVLIPKVWTPDPIMFPYFLHWLIFHGWNCVIECVRRSKHVLLGTPGCDDLLHPLKGFLHSWGHTSSMSARRSILFLLVLAAIGSSAKTAKTHSSFHPKHEIKDGNPSSEGFITYAVGRYHANAQMMFQRHVRCRPVLNVAL